jgi:uncharacterized protein (UPF0261 family)
MSIQNTPEKELAEIDRSSRAITQRDAVAIIATLDTKGDEVRYVSAALAAHGRSIVVFDIGTSGPFAKDHLLDGKASPSELLAVISKDVGKELTSRIHDGEITAVLGIAGGKGSAAFGLIVSDLPYGFPKMLVSSARPALLADLARTNDLIFYSTLVDLFGLNDFTEAVLTNATNAIAMMRFQQSRRSDRLIVAITAFGVTTPAVSLCVSQLKRAGIDSVVFPANGAGGQTMEKLIREGHFVGVVDLTTTELADEFVGGTASAGPYRMTAASQRGIPQLIAPGAIDMVNFGSLSSVPTKFQDRILFAHTPFTTVMRTTPLENLDIGRLTANKLSKSSGQVCVMWPKNGFSDYDRDDGIFFDPIADQAWLKGLKECLRPEINIFELDCHINDPEFAEAASAWIIHQLIKEKPSENV